MTEKRALGKGLSALIPEKIIGENIPAKDKILNVNIERIKTSKYQPREQFSEERLSELSKSIKEKGIVQPLLVRESPDGYELIAGERRLRALKALNIKEAPVIVKNVGDLDALELSLIENLQRESLNPLEEAHSYKRLVDEFNFTQDKISEAIGKDRSTIANTLRLLLLPQKIQAYIQKGILTIGHAKAILSLTGERKQIILCEKIIKKGLSVREAEVLASGHSKVTSKRSYEKDSFVKNMEEELQRILGTRVKISCGKKRGTISIEYFSNEDLERILKILRRQ